LYEKTGVLKQALKAEIKCVAILLHGTGVPRAATFVKNVTASKDNNTPTQKGRTRIAVSFSLHPFIFPRTPYNSWLIFCTSNVKRPTPKYCFFLSAFICG
jgi:hypothetical protein